jgi:hypothetical protein
MAKRQAVVKHMEKEMKALIAFCKAFFGLTLSNLSGKLSDVPAISFTGEGLNGSKAFCNLMSEVPGSICGKCYSRQGQTYKPELRASMARNGERIRSAVPTFSLPSWVTMFRINSHGELSDVREVHWVYQMAERNPSVKFALWTKRQCFVWAADEELAKFGLKRPENVVMIYSEPMIDKVRTVPPPGFDKVFCVISDLSVPVNCGAKECRSCRKCYTKESEAIIVEHLK